MKEIGFIFLFFGVGVGSVFGQHSDNNVNVSDAQQPNLEYGKSTRNVLIAQRVIAPNSEKASKKSTKQMETTDSENAETTRAGNAQPEKARRIFNIINDYQLTADAVLTTLVAIAADVTLQGRVTGNVLVIGGDVQLSPEAQVKGTLHIIGGWAAGNTQGVADLQISNDWQMVPAAVHLVMHPHVFWGISKQTNFRLTFVKVGISLLMYLLVVVIFSKPINAVSSLFARRPIGSIIFSILMLGVLPFLLTLLTLSIIGVPFMLLALSLLFPLAIFGKAAIFLTIGGTLFSGRWKPLAVIFGYVLYFMATSLPYIDWAAFLLINSIAIGLCILSGISTIRSQEPRRNVSPFSVTGGDPG